MQATAAALEDAQLEVQGYKCKLGIAELELAKQLDALRELQWQLDSVVAQLGLQQQLGGTGGGGNLDAGAALLSKVGRLLCAQALPCCLSIAPAAFRLILRGTVRHARGGEEPTQEACLLACRC